MRGKTKDRFDNNIWYQNNAGDLRYRNTRIMGYPVTILKYGVERNNVWYQLTVPMGENERDKKMFDDFVYNNKSLYNTKTQDKLIENFKKFVKNWKSKGG